MHRSGGGHSGTAQNNEKLVDSILSRTSLGTGSEDITVDKFLGDEAIDLLCARMQREAHTHIRKLTLRGNCIGPAGAKSIAGLLSNPALQHLVSLSLEWNQLASSGASILAEGMKENLSLTSLDLRNNGVGNEGAIALSDALMLNKSLLTLDLRWNQIEDKGILSFKDTILLRKPPLSISVNGNLQTESTNKLLDQWTERGRAMLNDENLPPPPSQSLPNPSVQADLLRDEVAHLRAQCKNLQNANDDAQRQLDSSSLKITQLEQELSREEYKASTLEDSLRQTNQRLAIQVDEQRAMKAAWELERDHLSARLLEISREKEDAVRAAHAEADAIKDKLRSVQEHNDRLKLQCEYCEQQRDVERRQATQDLDAALERINEHSIEESKLKAENAALIAGHSRDTNALATLKQELGLSKSDSERRLSEQEARLRALNEDLRAEYDAAVTEFQGKAKAQEETNHALEARVAHLELSLTKQRIDLEQTCLETANAARAGERQQHQQSIQELQQRVDMLVQARAELQCRCDAHVKEIQTAGKEHQEVMRNVQLQFEGLEAEASRLRAQNTAQKHTLSSQRDAVQSLTHQLEDCQARLATEEKQSSEWYKHLQTTLKEKQRQDARVLILERELAVRKEEKAREFSTISNQLKSSLERELESLRVNVLKICNPYDDAPPSSGPLSSEQTLIVAENRRRESREQTVVASAHSLGGSQSHANAARTANHSRTHNTDPDSRHRPYSYQNQHQQQEREHGRVATVGSATVRRATGSDKPRSVSSHPATEEGALMLSVQSGGEAVESVDAQGMQYNHSFKSEKTPFAAESVIYTAGFGAGGDAERGGAAEGYPATYDAPLPRRSQLDPAHIDQQHQQNQQRKQQETKDHELKVSQKQQRGLKVESSHRNAHPLGTSSAMSSNTLDSYEAQLTPGHRPQPQQQLQQPQQQAPPQHQQQHPHQHLSKQKSSQLPTQQQYDPPSSLLGSASHALSIEMTDPLHAVPDVAGDGKVGRALINPSVESPYAFSAGVRTSRSESFEDGGREMDREGDEDEGEGEDFEIEEEEDVEGDDFEESGGSRESGEESFEESGVSVPRASSRPASINGRAALSASQSADDSSEVEF